MKFLSIIMMALLSVGIANAQDAPKGGGAKIDKSGAAAKNAKGGGVAVGKGGASAKSSSGKGVQATKSGAKTTPATK